MSNADQLKYMRMKEQLDNQKKPTPIRKRPAPKPITFPTPKVTSVNTNDLTINNRTTGNNTVVDIPHPEPDTQRLAPFPQPPISVEMRNYIANAIARTLYRVADWPEAEIITMGQAQFEALCRSILEDAE